MIDRTIRPLFPDGFIDEIQIQAGVMSHDGQNDTDVLACTAGAAENRPPHNRRNTYDRCPTSPRYRASAGAGSAGRPRTRTGWTSHIW